jgi:hypothetical protein
MDATHGYWVEALRTSSPKTIALAGVAPTPKVSAAATIIEIFFIESPSDQARYRRDYVQPTTPVTNVSRSCYLEKSIKSSAPSLPAG